MRAAEPAHEITHGPDETASVAARLATGLRPGDVVLVTGDVGAGKTTFVRGACRALGVTEPVTSPTFTIGRRYDSGRVPVSHLDLFRLADLDAEDPALLADYVTDDSVTFVEWPEVAGPELGPERIVARVHLEHAGRDRRRVEVVR
jgi:tRNA threonylcarbamoyladenosine biosynthesis protein TsaE